MLETHGKAVAEHVATFEARQVDVIKELVQRENCDCDFEETRVTDVCFYKAGCEKIKADLAKIAKANISTAKGIEFTLGSEAEEVCSIWKRISPCHSIGEFPKRSDQSHRFLAFGVQNLAIHIMPLVCGPTDLWRTY